MPVHFTSKRALLHCKDGIFFSIALVTAWYGTDGSTVLYSATRCSTVLRGTMPASIMRAAASCEAAATHVSSQKKVNPQLAWMQVVGSGDI